VPKPSKILMFFLVAVLAGCSKPAKPQPTTYSIDRFQFSDSTLKANPALAMTSDDLRLETYSALDRSARFVALAPTSGPRASEVKALRCKVEVAFTREVLDGADAKAEVGVAMELRRPGEVDRFHSSGMGRATFKSTDPAARIPAFRQALRGALDEVARSNAMQLDAQSKTDAELIADLPSTDPRARDFSVRVLAERRNAAAVPALIERLKDPDREIALRAVGALKSIGDPRAVPALIEMSQTRDPQFVIALVDVVATLGGKDAEAFLFTVESGHAEEAVRLAAREAQERLRSYDAGSAEPQPRSE